MNISFPLTGLHALTRAAHRVLCWEDAELHAGEFLSRKSLLVEEKKTSRKLDVLQEDGYVIL